MITIATFMITYCMLWIGAAIGIQGGMVKTEEEWMQQYLSRALCGPQTGLAFLGLVQSVSPPHTPTPELPHAN